MAVDVIATHAFFYALIVASERLTLQLARDDGGWRFEELLGVENAPPSEQARRAVRRWLRREAVGVPDGANLEVGAEIPF